jgi:hypothetical protein
VGMYARCAAISGPGCKISDKDLLESAARAKGEQLSWIPNGEAASIGDEVSGCDIRIVDPREAVLTGTAYGLELMQHISTFPIRKMRTN